MASKLSATMLPMDLSWAAIILLTVVVFFSLLKRTPDARLPPGPRGMPVIGNILQLRKRTLWITFDKWTSQYGPIFSLDAAGQTVVVLGSHQTANDLLAKRGSIYSHRPRLIVAFELLTGGLAFAFGQADSTWKRLRRAAHETLSKQVVSQYMKVQEREMVLLIDQFMKQPEHFHDHIARLGTSLMISTTYGLTPLLDSNDPVILRVSGFAERLTEATLPGRYLVEHFPWMLYLPLWMCPWRKQAEGWFLRDTAMLEEMYTDVGHRSQTGIQSPCIASMLIQNGPQNHISSREAAWTCATLYAAGAETIAASIEWFIVAMLLHPEIQSKAQEEIDRVVGRDRPPSFSDFNNLSYIRAILKETMRWKPIAPLGVPHCLAQDDWYQGYFLPKGTVCLVNVWGLNRDPEVYGPDADQFRPERFLDTAGELKVMPLNVRDDGHFTYGFGQRICVGRHLADNSLFIALASILWAFTLRPLKSENRDILPDPNNFLDRGIAVLPGTFACNIIPRSTGIEAVVSEMRDRFELPP